MRRLTVILAMLMMMLIGCSAEAKVETSKVYTIDVETGHQVRMEIDTTNGCDLRDGEDGTYIITNGGKDIIQGTFIKAVDKGRYMNAVRMNKSAKITQDSADCFAWTADGESGKEYDRIVAIKGTDEIYALMGALVASEEEMETAENAYTAVLSITAEDS